MKIERMSTDELVKQVQISDNINLSKAICYELGYRLEAAKSGVSIHVIKEKYKHTHPKELDEYK